MPTDVTRTIGTSSRDYSTLAAWEADIPADLVTADERWIGECYNDSEFTDAVNHVCDIASHASDATRHIILRAATGEGFRDHANKATNPLRYDHSVGVGVQHSDTTTSNKSAVRVAGTAFVQIFGLQLKSRSRYGEGCALFSGSNSTLVDSNILERDSTAGGPAVAFAAAAGCKLRSTAVIQRSNGGDGVQILFGNSAGGVYGCTIVRTTGTGAYAVESHIPNDFVIKNTAAFGFTDFADWTASSPSDYNASDDATNIPGANSNGTLTYADQFEDNGNTTPDFRAKSTGDLQFGTPDSTNTPDDIIGTTRDATTPWVGCWEVPAAGGGGFIHQDKLGFGAGHAPFRASVF